MLTHTHIHRYRQTHTQKVTHKFTKHKEVNTPEVSIHFGVQVHIRGNVIRINSELCERTDGIYIMKIYMRRTCQLV